MVFELIEENFVAVIIASFLILFAMTNNNFKKRTNRFFLGAAVCILILIVEEAWEARLALADTPVVMRTVLSSIGYSLRPLIPYFLLKTEKKGTRKEFILFSFPLVFNAMVSFSALFCKLSFWYTPDNEFVRGPLGTTPFVVAGFYMIILLVQTVRGWRKGGFKEALIVSAIVILAFLSTLMESLFGFQFIQNPCMATSITFYYLYLNCNQNNRDPLTGAMTRRRFYLDAEKNSSTLTAVISLDVNNLKTLNDQYGHAEGDKALTTVSDIVKKYMGRRASLYRVGGDEFVILCYKLDEEAVQKMIRKIRSDLKQTKYTCAMGYALYTQKHSFETICQVADRVMYEDKKLMKAQR